MVTGYDNEYLWVLISVENYVYSLFFVCVESIQSVMNGSIIDVTL